MALSSDGGDSGAMQFNMADDDTEEQNSNPPAESSSAARAETEEERRRSAEHMRWLNADDQKVVCRRTCEQALKCEEALKKRLEDCLFRYERALELCKAVKESSGSDPIPADLCEAYRCRIELIRGTLKALESEILVAPPGLGAAERAKSYVFEGYSRTAEGLKEILPVAPEGFAAQGQQATESVKNAFNGLTSLFKGRSEVEPQSQVTAAQPASRAASSALTAPQAEAQVSDGWAEAKEPASSSSSSSSTGGAWS